MPRMNTPHRFRLTEMLTSYSSRLDDISLAVQRFGAQPLELELLDELAVTVDELLLTLDEHRRAFGDDPLVDELISDARQLIGIVRRRSLPQERLAGATSDVIFKIGRVVHADKQAA